MVILLPLYKISFVHSDMYFPSDEKGSDIYRSFAC